MLIPACLRCVQEKVGAGTAPAYCTSHRVLDPQDAADQVRRLAKHPDATFHSPQAGVHVETREKRLTSPGAHVAPDER